MSGATPARRHDGDPLHRFRRGFARYRRWLAAGSVGLAVAAGVRVLQPPSPSTQQLRVAARDLPANHVLTAADVTVMNWPQGNRPDGLLAAPLGRVLAAPIRRGEPLTDARVTGPGLLIGLPAGMVAITVRLGDPASTLLLVPGRRVELLGGPIADGSGADTPVSGGADTDAGNAKDGNSTWRRQVEVLAADALVLAVPQHAESGESSGLTSGIGGGGSHGPAADEQAAGGTGIMAGSTGETPGTIVVAVDHETATRLAAATGTRSITVALTGPS